MTSELYPIEESQLKLTSNEKFPPDEERGNSLNTQRGKRDLNTLSMSEGRVSILKIKPDLRVKVQSSTNESAAEKPILPNFTSEIFQF